MDKNTALVIRHLSNRTFARLLNKEKFKFREPVFFYRIVCKRAHPDGITICKCWFRDLASFVKIPGKKNGFRKTLFYLLARTRLIMTGSGLLIDRSTPGLILANSIVLHEIQRPPEKFESAALFLLKARAIIYNKGSF